MVVHPRLSESRGNRLMMEAAAKVPGVTVHDLYATYPDGKLDIAREQALVERHRALVWQFPFYWFHSPPLLKQWQDEVLQYGWAFGRSGQALQGKSLTVAMTMGGSVDDYAPSLDFPYGLDALLSPFAASAAYVGMRYLPPFVIGGFSRDPKTRITEEQLDRRLAEYQELLASLAAN